MSALRLGARLACAGALISLLACAPAAALVPSSGYEQTDNWAGYQDTATGSFDQISGSWVQPTNECTKAVPYSMLSPWLGIGDPGGAGRQGTRIEQIGSTETCIWRHGKRTQIARGIWENWPSPSHSVRHPMEPGDRLSAAVLISGHELTMTLQDLTRHWKFVKRLTVAAPDERSAEWIVEATGFSNIPGQHSPLASFTPVTFTRAKAGDTSGQTGAIGSPDWEANRIAMIFSPPARLRAWPSALKAGGTSFTVTPADRVPPAEPPPPV